MRVSEGIDRKRERREIIEQEPSEAKLAEFRQELRWLLRSAGHLLGLATDPDFPEFLVSELLPWVHARYNVTTDPRLTVVAGASYGGLAATYAALRHPEVFGNVLC